jgi:hypothetical protein
LNICGFDYKVTFSSEEFLNFKGAKINYSNREFPGPCIKYLCIGFSCYKKELKNLYHQQKPKTTPFIFFRCMKATLSYDFGFDIFSACFYMLSRYEEYLPFLEDRHGRFEADQSIAYQMGFLDVPVVDVYAMELKSGLLRLFPFTDATNRSFTFIPTYDIDIAYAYKGKGLTRNMLAIAKDIVTFQFKNLISRIKVMANLERDPYDTYEFQLDLQKKYRLEPIYFFLCGQFGPKDRNISIHSRTFFHLVKTIGDYAITGIHPSYESNFNEKALKQEFEFLSGMLHQTIQYSRQHFLRLRLPHTYHSLIKIDIQYDFTMGYASHTGFRAGTCSPFNFYDLSLESETRLKVFPLTLMDGTLKEYMKLKPQDALERAKKLVDAVRAVNGTFVSLWHNDALNNEKQWVGWQQVYVEMIQYITDAPFQAKDDNI